MAEQEAVGGAEAIEDSVGSRRLFEARLAELGFARDEVVGAIANQHLVLTFGAASILAVLVAGFVTWSSPASWAIFFAVPPISAWVMGMWLAEVVRMLRAGHFCSEQEELINRSSATEPGPPALRWESRWRRTEAGRSIRWPYLSVVAILTGAYLTAVPLGLVKADWPVIWTILVAVLFGAGLVFLLALVFRIYRAWGADRQIA